MKRLSATKMTLALAAIAVFSPSAWCADLLAIFKDAFANDATYASARSTLEAGREALPQGLAGLLPTVGATLNTTRNEANVTFRSPTAFPAGTRVFNTNGYSMWEPAKTYALNAVVRHGPNVYICTHAGATGAVAPVHTEDRRYDGQTSTAVEPLSE